MKISIRTAQVTALFLVAVATAVTTQPPVEKSATLESSRVSYSAACAPLPHFPNVSKPPSVGTGGSNRATAPAKGKAPLGYYGSPVRYASGSHKGHIDVGKTVAAIKKSGASFYQILIANHWGYNSLWDWQSTPELLDALHRNTIDAGVILLPTTEASTVCACTSDHYAPYNGSYDKWYKQIGVIARTHPALKYDGMDDYSFSSMARPNRDCNSFPAGLPAHWQALASAAAGRPIPFTPTMYFPDMANGRSQNFNALGPKITRVVWPFENIGRAGLMPKQFKLIQGWHPKVCMTIMVYASYYKGMMPTPATVRRELATARALHPCGGVVAYQYKL